MAKPEYQVALDTLLRRADEPLEVVLHNGRSVRIADVSTVESVVGDAVVLVNAKSDDRPRDFFYPTQIRSIRSDAADWPLFDSDSHSVEPRFDRLEVGSVRCVAGGDGGPASYSEFVVNGCSLSTILSTSNLPALDCRGDASSGRELLLRTASPLPSGRVPLYVCSECTDLGCGCIAARIERRADRYVWSDFHWDSHHKMPDDPNDAGDEPDGSMLRELVFERQAYEAALAAFCTSA